MSRSSKHVLLLLLLLGGLPLAATPASAAPDRATRLAKRHNARAERLFNLGQFREAAEAYEQAYQAKPLPLFLHNLGQCHKRIAAMENLEKALFYFESYLQNAPQAPNRADVEEEIAALKKQIAALKAPKVRPPPPKPQPQLALVPRPEPVAAPEPAEPPRKPIYKRWWFWTAIGAVAAGSATAVVLATRPDSVSPVNGTIPPGQIQLK